MVHFSLLPPPSLSSPFFTLFYPLILTYLEILVTLSLPFTPPSLLYLLLFPRKPVLSLSSLPQLLASTSRFPQVALHHRSSLLHILPTAMHDHRVFLKTSIKWGGIVFGDLLESSSYLPNLKNNSCCRSFSNRVDPPRWGSKNKIFQSWQSLGIFLSPRLVNLHPFTLFISSFYLHGKLCYILFYIRIQYARLHTPRTKKRIWGSLLPLYSDRIPELQFSFSILRRWGFHIQFPL